MAAPLQSANTDTVTQNVNLAWIHVGSDYRRDTRHLTERDTETMPPRRMLLCTTRDSAFLCCISGEKNRVVVSRNRGGMFRRGGMCSGVHVADTR
uniref:Uncharacterized protein n=1 Tax=Oryza glaberrima TaxID=4538 RepID=I1NT96_ORYGL